MSHSKHSASGSSRWLNCPGSIKACESYDNSSSIFALEGTLAHMLADECITSGKEAVHFIDSEVSDLTTDVNVIDEMEKNDVGSISREMCRHVQSYLDYVYSFQDKSSLALSEVRVNYNHLAKDGFGTCDYAILNDGDIHIFDLKYGMTLVQAENNTQCMLYALGCLNDFDFLYDKVSHITIHIVQPRRVNYSKWEVSTKELLEWAECVKARVKLTLVSNPVRNAGAKQCHWCLAQSDCNVLGQYVEDVLCSDLEDLTQDVDSLMLSDDDKRRILDNKVMIEKFLKSVYNDVYGTLIGGGTFEGYKLVEGRSSRIWVDGAESAVYEKLGEEAYKKSFIGVTQADKLLDKDFVSNFTVKPQAKLQAVRQDDVRKGVTVDKIVDLF